MIRKITILIVFLFLGLLAKAQEHFYYYKGEKIPLTLNKERVNFRANSNFDRGELERNNLKELAFFKDDSKSGAVFLTVEVESKNYEVQINTISSLRNVTGVFPSFTNNAGQSVDMTDYLYVKLKKNVDFKVLERLVNDEKLYIIEQNKFMPLWYTLRLSENFKENTLEFANKLYERGLFEAVETDFMSDDMLCVNDPYFTEQWGLKNTGQNGGTAGIDIKACDTWAISKGKNTTVAIVDGGIELNHEDLVDNIHSLSYDTESGTSPSIVLDRHGTACAGIVGAVQDNDIGISGIAPKSKLMSISNSLAGTPNSRMKRADGINWAWQNGADVITNSWRSGVMYTVIDDAIDNALTNGRNGKGCVIVFSAGNDNSSVNYPANSNSKIVVVGAISQCGERKSPTSCDGENWWGSNYGTQLDVMAPGVKIYTTDLSGASGYNSGDYTSTFNGTSAAAPYIAGVAALVLSVNPNLTEADVRNIIESTAQKVRTDLYSYTTHTGRTNGTWNNQMGYGLVDAYAAVQKAQETLKLDLYIKNSSQDTGIEPDVVTGVPVYNSPDIWTRNIDDGGLTYENPEYDAFYPNYVYVRVRNRGTKPSTTQDSLKLHWAKAGTSLMWPAYWDGNLTYNNIPMGGIVGTKPIPIVQPGESVIVKFAWHIPNPEDYISINPEPWHFCLLGRILSEDDPMTELEVFNLGTNVRNNNNIGWKNVTVVDVQPDKPIGGVVLVSNPYGTIKNYHLEFMLDRAEIGKPIFKEAEVKATLSQSVYDAWVRGGKQGEGIEERDGRAVIIKTDNARLLNLVFEPYEMGTVNLTFNFLTQEVTEKDEFLYHFVQLRAEDESLVGGEAYLIKKHPRQLFYAEAGNDIAVNKNEVITLSAGDIGETAVYNWYDEDGNLLHEGKNYQMTSDSNKQFTLEITADADGYKDYDEVAVTLKHNALKVVAPNPASSGITVGYAINNGDSAYISVVPVYGSVPGNGTNYTLNIDEQQIQIDLSGYANGVYKVILYCDGNLVSSENLIINH